mmetsp:Transcript_26574/g.76279  ORF Transcript_26574/g.76279 Transcript_26574/m.76279 type:complete len:352 (-) Transcript_26574:1110-2165(-)
MELLPHLRQLVPGGGLVRADALRAGHVGPSTKLHWLFFDLVDLQLGLLHRYEAAVLVLIRGGQSRDEVGAHNVLVRIPCPQLLDRRLHAEETLDGLAQGAVDLLQVLIFHRQGARLRGADHAVAEARGVHVGLRQLPIAAQPVDLQLVPRGQPRVVAGGARSSRASGACRLRGLLARRLLLSGLLLLPQRKGHSHGPVVLFALMDARRGGAELLSHGKRALVGPPMPNLLLIAAVLDLQGSQWASCHVPLEPFFRVGRQVQDLLKHLVQRDHWHRQHARPARAVAELQHDRVLHAQAQLLGDAAGQALVVDAGEPGLLRQQETVARALDDVVGQLLVGGDHGVPRSGRAFL